MIQYMESEEGQNFDCIRQQEKMYENEIRKTYQDHPHLFLTHSSDSLHLRLASLSRHGINYQGIMTKSSYEKYDIIAEIRGSVINFDKLKDLIHKKQVEKDKLPTLLFLSPEQKYLLSPKNITKYLFSSPLYSFRLRQSLEVGCEGQDNCYIQRHFDSKLLITASRNICPGQELILEQKSFNNFVFNKQREEVDKT